MSGTIQLLHRRDGLLRLASNLRVDGLNALVAVAVSTRLFARPRSIRRIAVPEETSDKVSQFYTLFLLLGNRTARHGDYRRRLQPLRPDARSGRPNKLCISLGWAPSGPRSRLTSTCHHGNDRSVVLPLRSRLPLHQDRFPEYVSTSRSKLKANDLLRLASDFRRVRSHHGRRLDQDGVLPSALPGCRTPTPMAPTTTSATARATCHEGHDLRHDPSHYSRYSELNSPFVQLDWSNIVVWMSVIWRFWLASISALAQSRVCERSSPSSSSPKSATWSAAFGWPTKPA